MWVKYLTATKNRKVGEVFDIADDLATTLIDNAICEKTTAPAATGAEAGVVASITDAVFKRITSTGKGIYTPGGSTQTEDKPADVQGKSFDCYAQVRRYKTLESYSNDEAGYRKAYRFGMWCIANASKNSQGFRAPWAIDWCQKNGLGFVAGDDVGQKATRENNSTSAGFLVPDEFENDLIDLREQYGVFRKYAKKVPMSSDTRSDPRRRGGVTSYWVGESQSGTYADKTWDRVRLTAKKMMCLTRISNEINEDAVINLGDDYAKEIAYSFANKEDAAGFIGTGTSTYGGIVGVTKALTNVDATIANILGLYVGTAGSAQQYSSLTLTDFNNVVSLLPEFADNENCCWFVHRLLWGSVMQRLATAAGGNKVDEIVNGARIKTFLGYPVVIVQVMPKAPTTNQVCALLGDLSMAASFGDRRATTLQFSDVADNAFTQDEIVIRGTQRIDINVHDVGESSAAAPRDAIMGTIAGPVVGLITPAS